MTTEATWTLLIATLGQRHARMERLLRGLMPQVDRAGGAVKVMAYFDSGELTERHGGALGAVGGALGAIATKRQSLVEATTTEYLSFIDDDDTVSTDFVESILEALRSGPDFVGFWSKIYRNSHFYKMSKMSLEYDGWTRGTAHLCRDITHLNPMRSDIVRTADFRVRGTSQPEDVAWAEQLRRGGLLRTQVFIDRTLHNYWWTPSQSTWRLNRVRRVDPRGRPWPPPVVSSPNFSWHPDSIFPEAPRG